MDSQWKGKVVRVGYGSAYENDRIEQGVVLAERGDVKDSLNR